MRKRMVIFMMGVGLYAFAFAQVGWAQPSVSLSSDTLTVPLPTDSLPTGPLAAETSDTLARDSLVRQVWAYVDSLNRLPDSRYNRDAFKFQYDAFREKMRKEPWLDGLLKNILFH